MITIDIEYLKKIQLTPDEWILLFLLKEKKYEDIEVFNVNISYLRLLIKRLSESGYIININNPLEPLNYSKLLLTAKSLVLFKTKENGFERLYNTYPHKVYNSNRGTTRVLRPVSLSSSIAKECKELYKRIIKNKPELEDKIYNALLLQLSVERNNLEWLQEFKRWLSKGTYEKYFDMKEEENTQITEKRL